MDKTKKLFDEWAVTGRAEEMEKGHGVTVNKFLDSISFDKPFSFLDVGCGNGPSPSLSPSFYFCLCEHS